MTSTVVATANHIKHINQFVLWLARVVKMCVWTTLFLVVATYLLLAPAIDRPLYDFILFHGAPFNAVQYQDQVWYGGIRRQEYFIPVKNQANTPLINAWYFEVPNAKHVVLMHHGQGGNLLTYQFFAALFMKLDCSVLIYDYEGYGRSTGHPTIPGLVTDGEAAYYWLIREKHVKPQQLVHVGVSLGTGVASTVGQKCPCAGIILFSPYDSLMKIGHQRLPYLNCYPDWLIGYPDLGSVVPLSKPHPPVLMLHGRKDCIIPIEDAEEIADAADKRGFKYVRFERAGHTDFFSNEPQRCLHVLNAFLFSLPNSSASQQRQYKPDITVHS